MASPSGFTSTRWTSLRLILTMMCLWKLMIICMNLLWFLITHILTKPAIYLMIRCLHRILHIIHIQTHPPGPDPGSQPPDPPLPPGPPHAGTTVPTTQHQPIPQQHLHPPTTLPLQPLPADAFIPSLVVPPTVPDTPMRHPIKRESGQPASSPQKKAKAPAPGAQCLLPLVLRLATIWGLMFQSLFLRSLQSPKLQSLMIILMKMKMRLTHKLDPVQGPPILPVNDDEETNQPSSHKHQTMGLMMTEAIP